MAAGCILGWKGNEEEEVDIGGSEEEGVAENASLEHSLGAADSVRARTSSNSAGERATANAPSPPPRNDDYPGKDSRELPGESDQAGKRDEDPAAAESNADPSSRGNTVEMEIEGDDQRSSRKRMLEARLHSDHKRRKSDDWKTRQWVACILCRKWRR